MQVRRVEQATDVAIAIFLWTFRIFVIFIVVVGSILTLASGKYSAETWASLIVSGLTLGSIYALIALGYTMVYGILRMINFAHGEIFMIGAFAGYFTAVGLNQIGFLNASPLASLISVAIMIAVAAAVATPVALLVERIAYRPLRNAPRLVPLIAAIGASFFLQYTVRGLFGPGIYSYPTVDVLEEQIPLGFIRLRWVDVIIIGSAFVMMTGLYLFVMRSKLGTAIRAVSEDKEAAALMGIDVNRAIVSTFAIGAAMAGAAGVLYGLLFRQVFFFTGFIPGLKAFTAAVLGGIGNIPGAMLGGLFLGEIEAIGPTLFLDGFNVPSPNQLKDVIAFTMLVLVLVFRPSGILWGADHEAAGMTTMSAASSSHESVSPAAPAVRGFAAWRGVVRVGLIGGAVALYLCLVGIVPVFNGRPLVDTVISLGQASLLLTFVGAGYVATLRAPSGKRQAIAAGALAGALSGVVLSLLVLVGSVVDLRAVFLNASPELYSILTAGMGTSGFWVPTAVGLLFGLLAGMSSTLPANTRKSLFVGLSGLVIMGLFSGLLRTPMLNGPLSELARFLFASEGLTPIGAAITVVVSVGAYQFQQRYRIERRIANMPADRKRTATVPFAIIVFLLIVALPQGLGPFFAQVIAIVAIYILMGFGLNITLGLAGLLDLGFVAFFAVGAYTVGLLTSTAEYGIADWSFWAAVPFAILAAMLFGAFLGLPILGIRGDYLAIATLGFGEIIRILAGSDLMKPILGGPRGIINIPKPIDVPIDSWLAGPNQIYYIALACAALIAFVAWRLRASRLGRAWVAIREDEDVAEAIGINLVQTKLLAYILGAGFAGLGGAIFASLVGSIFASSIQLFVSINVAALIIVGGMGSIPGVVVGAIFLIGLPELFREFSEYRFLFYGIALIAMMRFRPEGLLPSRIVKREFHVADSADNVDAPGAEPYGLIAEEEATT